MEQLQYISWPVAFLGAVVVICFTVIVLNIIDDTEKHYEKAVQLIKDTGAK